MDLKIIYKEEFHKCLEEIGEAGFVESVTPPIAYVTGLPGLHQREVVYFDSGDIGMVLSLSRHLAEVLVFSRDPAKAGSQVSRSNRILQIPVAEGLLGHAINPLGYPLYEGEAPVRSNEYRPIDNPSPGIDRREKITEAFETGVTVVDLMLPLGKGQRELIIGDRKTGKTEFLMQTILSQAAKGVICIYAGIGRKKVDIKKIEEFVKRNRIKDTIVMIATASTDPLGLIYITPYAAMTLAEYFRDIGREVLIILDDLSTHAKFYREISLTAKRFPGRNSYPGDIFYTHSRLLERAGNFKTEYGTRSITCLPVAEAIEGDISGYIQTNLMSITDGHIFFDQELFGQGRRPAVSYFMSVTRVGRQTQTKLRWGINRELSSFLTLLEKTQRFVHFGAELNEGIKATLVMGEKVFTFLDQSMGKIVGLNLQIVLFCLIWLGVLGGPDLTHMKYLMEKGALLYGQDKEFRCKIDELVGGTDDFNQFLGRVSAQAKVVINYIENA